MESVVLTCIYLKLSRKKDEIFDRLTVMMYFDFGEGPFGLQMLKFLLAEGPLEKIYK